MPSLPQSREIRFGDALEQILDAYLIEGGYGLLPKSLFGGRAQAEAAGSAFLTLCTRGKFEDKSIEISPFEVII